MLEPRTFLADLNLVLDETQEYPEYIISSGSFTESGETGFALKVATGYDESYEKGQLGIRINGIDAWAENADRRNLLQPADQSMELEFVTEYVPYV